MKIFKYIPVALVFVYFFKCLFKSPSTEDAIVLISLVFLASIYSWVEKHKSNTEIANKYKELQEFCKKELAIKEEVQTKIQADIDNLKSSVASVKMSAGLKTTYGLGAVKNG